MFDIGFWEILIIGVVALLIVGPDRLPGLVTFVGQWVGRARRFANHMRNEIRDELETEQLKNLLDEQNRELGKLRQEVDEVRDDTVRSVKEVREETEKALNEEPDAAQATGADRHGADDADGTGGTATGETRTAAAEPAAGSERPEPSDTDEYERPGR